MTAVPFSIRRTLLIAGATLRESARQRVFGLLVVLALGLVFGVRYLRDFNFGSPEAKFIADFGDGAIAFFGAILTVVVTAQVFLGEIENRTALTLLAKAVRRTEFVFGKYLGVVVVTALFCAVMGGALAAVLWTMGLGAADGIRGALQFGAPGWGALAAVCWLQWLKLAMLGAGTLLVACFAQTQLYTVMVGSAIWVVCHLQNLAPENSMVRRVIGAVFPDFQLFPTSVDAAMTAGDLARLTFYAGGHVAVTCALAAYVFSKREL